MHVDTLHSAFSVLVAPRRPLQVVLAACLSACERLNVNTCGRARPARPYDGLVCLKVHWQMFSLLDEFWPVVVYLVWQSVKYCSA